MKTRPVLVIAGGECLVLEEYSTLGEHSFRFGFSPGASVWFWKSTRCWASTRSGLGEYSLLDEYLNRKGEFEC